MVVEIVGPSVSPEDTIVGAILVAAFDFSVDSVKPLGRESDRSGSAPTMAIGVGTAPAGIGAEEVPYAGTGDAASICRFELSTASIG